MKAQKPNTPKKGLDDFINEAADTKINGAAPSEKENDTNKSEENLKRQTYYIDPVYIKALGLMSKFQDTPINVLVRGFFEECIPQKYVDQAREIINNLSGR